MALLLIALLTILAVDSGSETAVPRTARPALELSHAASDDELSDTCGAAIDAEGNVYVANSVDSTISIFKLNGAYLGGIRGSGEPCRLAVDATGAVYASDAERGIVLKYEPDVFPFDGRPTYAAPITIDASGEARGIGVDPYDNRLFVAKGDRIDVYKRNGVLGQNEVQRVLIADYTGGTFRLSFKGAVTGPLRFDATQAEVESALAELPTIGSGNVSVREGTNGAQDHFVTFTGDLERTEVPLMRIDFSSLEGGPPRAPLAERLVKAFSGHLGQGTLSNAVEVGAYTYDGAKSGVGGLLAEDAQLVGREHRDELFDPTSTSRLVDFGLERTEAPQEPNRVLVDHRPQVYRGYERYVFVADTAGTAADRIIVFASNEIGAMSIITSIDGSKTPDGSMELGSEASAIGVDPESGHFFVHDAGHSTVDEFEATGPYVGQVEDSALGDAESVGIGVDRSGGRNDGALLIASGGSELLAFGPLERRVHAAEPDRSIDAAETCGATVDSTGNEYISRGSAIEIFDPDGERLSRIDVPAGPCSLAVDSRGNVYAVVGADDLEGDAQIVLFEPDTFPPTDASRYTKRKTVAEYNGTQRWIAVDADDRLLAIADEARIEEFSTAAEGSELLRGDIGASLHAGAESFGGGLDVCEKTGDIYVAGRGSGGWLVYVLNPSGTKILTAIDGSGSPKGPFAEDTAAIAVDQSNCHALVALPERGIEEYEASGTYVTRIGSPYFFGDDVVVDNGADSPNQGYVYVAGAEGVEAFGPLSFEP